MSTYAIIQTGGKQYRVAPGDVLNVELIADKEPGDTVNIDQVLLVSNDGDVSIGKPYVSGAKVVAKVEGQGKGEKKLVFKFKPKVRYQRKQGHRQSLTKLAIKEIVAGGDAAARPRRRQARGA